MDYNAWHDENYCEGYAAFWQSKVLGDNPFKYGTIEFQMWSSGWVDAFHETLWDLKNGRQYH